ncbi:hypothetical protein TF_55 [Pseudomonas phage vB_PaeP_TF17]|nr:hypothetical protein TF_55 [Pseudomonas phage vB_PaeP_TF17]
MANSSFLKSLLQPSANPNPQPNPNPNPGTDSSLGTEKELVLTLADLEAEVPSSDLAQPNPFPKAKAKKGGTFLTKQFPLFTTSISLVYLQGVLPIQPDWTLANFLAHAKVRTVGSPQWREANSSLTSAHLATLKSIKASLYSPEGKASQLDLINRLLEAGGTIDPAKALSRANALASLDSYLEYLEIFLTREGFDDPNKWLASKTGSGLTIGSPLTQSQIADMDW